MGPPPAIGAGCGRIHAGARRSAGRGGSGVARTRTRLSTDARRAQLLALGVRRFSDRPFDEFSMEDAAAEAGVSKGLLYHYFPSKRAYYLAALRAAAAELLDLTRPDPELAPDDQLREGLEAYLAYVEQHAPAYRAVLRGGIGSDPEVATVAESVRHSMAERILAGLGVDVPRPRLRLAVAGWVGLVEAASLDWLDHGGPSRRALAEMLAGALPAILAVAYPPST